MSLDRDVADHYAEVGLLARIDAALAAAGFEPEQVTIDALRPLDEFHIGGSKATDALLDQVEISASAMVLDLGSGVGGTARRIASSAGCSVIGVDMTPDFVDTARTLTARVGLSDRIRFEQGDALAPPVAPGSIDLALMLHVGMNIPDKPGLMAAVRRALKPGGTFAIYDVMLGASGAAPTFPLPWAGAAETSFLAPPAAYRAAAEAARFLVVAERDRRDVAISFFERLAARVAEHGPPPLGVHILMGEAAPRKVANMVAGLADGAFTPVELILRAPEGHAARA